MPDLNEQPTEKEIDKALERADYCSEKGHCNHPEKESETYEWLLAKSLCVLASALRACREELAGERHLRREAQGLFDGEKELRRLDNLKAEADRDRLARELATAEESEKLYAKAAGAEAKLREKAEAENAALKKNLEVGNEMHGKDVATINALREKLARCVKALKKGIELVTSEYCSHPHPCGPNRDGCYASELYQALAAAQEEK